VRYILFITLIYSSLFAIQTSDKLFECTKIFQQRKGELLVELERIDEQKQALSALKIATENLLKEKEAKLNLQEEKLNTTTIETKKREQSIKEMLKKNSQILKDIKSIKMSKISQTFSKMKAGAAASILADMPNEEAAVILQSLKPKVVGKIFTKMDAKKASNLTSLLGK